MRILLAFRCFFAVLFGGRLPEAARGLLPSPEESGDESGEPARLPPRAGSSSGAPASPAKPPVDEGAVAIRGALQMLSLLQREGRLLDFLQEDIDAYGDAQIGAAVRDIHRGCRKVLAEHLVVEPVIPQPDNASVRVEPGFDPSRIRLVGNVVGDPPFLGTLRHPGWRGHDLKLPASAGADDPSIIAPAEVEL